MRGSAFTDDNGPTAAELGIHEVPPYAPEELRAMESAVTPGAPLAEPPPAAEPEKPAEPQPMPLHIRVKNLEERVDGARADHDGDVTTLRRRCDALAAVNRELLARLQEIGDWVNAPEWTPGQEIVKQAGEGS